MAIDNKSNQKNPVSYPPRERKIVDNRVESTMRVFANHLIDRLLEIQKEAGKKGLNINKEKVMLIMEHE